MKPTPYQAMLLRAIHERETEAILWVEPALNRLVPRWAPHLLSQHTSHWCVRTVALQILIERGWVELTDERIPVPASISKYEVYRITAAGLAASPAPAVKG